MNKSRDELILPFGPHHICLKEGDEIKLLPHNFKTDSCGLAKKSLYNKVHKIDKISKPYIVIKDHLFMFRHLDMKYLKKKYNL